MKNLPENKWDVFISHASEDKKEFAATLADTLNRFGIKVWYDEYELKLGDSLSRSIDAGLAKSDYGLVVLSKAFFAKRWPERELSGLVSREMVGKKVILPIWRGVSFEEVVKYSPPLADKYAINSDSISINQLAVKIIEIIRPELFQKIQRRKSYFSQLNNSKIIKVKISKIRESPIRHQHLSEEIISRIRLIRASLLGVYTLSMNSCLDGFMRDSHPSQEVAYWERVSSVYLEYTSMTSEIKTLDQHKAVFRYISTLWLNDADTEEEHRRLIPENAPEVINSLYNSRLPSYDIKDEDIKLDEANTSEENDADEELFPNDLPNDIIKDIMKYDY
ncbi:toll/interleukin-1 receptor domain-containing protein [Gluconacetobacter asukensis]|uniref:Toll/interleukin-1 receptor domain-containing protein n=1 Tax=Gluconacetobacter asukensis TaxID=1017181 RepID=A0A7W4J3N8_9PROT|nr:toll/interleukin-1 receptor domain-containing protein [Gluconacetobacter asukensis]MBB2174069.1 toll/interleukin-1 receptor domain-containing protein [Gluconacetobacter asukensis]